MEKLEFICNRQGNLFDVIMEQKSNLSFALLKTLLRKKDIRINGKKVSTNQMVEENDVITAFLPPKKQRSCPVIYEDDKIMIVSKPSGIETTKAHKTYLESDCLEEIFEGTYACHRLDKNTEGLIVLAKSKKLANQMEEVIKQKKMHKFYQTIVSGNVIEEGQNLVDYHVKGDNHVQIYSKEVDNSKKILTNYTVLKKQGDLSLLNVELLTGRTHQIRAHLAFHKIYVLGDQKYGDKETNKKYRVHRQLLCATKIVFDKMPTIFENLSEKTFEICPSFDLNNFKV